MTRTLRNHRSIVGVLSIVTLIVLIGAAGLAQMLGARQPRWQSEVRQARLTTGGAGPARVIPRGRMLNQAASPTPVSFLGPAYYASGGYSSIYYWGAVAVADLNGDRKPDLAFANICVDSSCDSNGTVGVLLGNGDGTFQPAVTYDAGGGGTIFVAIADVNGDGKPDLLAANASSDSVGVLLGCGDGAFQPVVTYASGGDSPISIAVADVNRDGAPDLAVVNNYGPVSVLLGNGDGTFEPAVTYDSGGGWPTSVAATDVNGDGKPDLIVANSIEGTVGVLLGNGDGTFRPGVTYGSGGSTANSVAAADVNGDGKPDIVVANCSPSGANSCLDLELRDGTVGVLLGNGDGTFRAVVAYDAGGAGAWSAVVADVNGDRKPDIVVVNVDPSQNAFGILLNNGDGTFQPPVTSYEPSGTSLAVADVNGDGKRDVIVATADWAGNGLAAVLINDTAFPHGSQTKVTTSGSPTFVGQSVTFTATVTSKFGTIPDGDTVTFYDGKTTLASVALSAGTAPYTTSSLLAKTHYIKAKYAGDATFKPSSGSVQQEVLKYPTTATLTSSPNPSKYGQPVAFTATVTPSGPYAPTGKVKFFDGTIAIGSATLNGGVAKLTKSALTVGTHPITAQYLSDAYNDKSTSPVVNQVVQ